MSQTATKILLPQTSFNPSSPPTIINGEKQSAASYYLSSKSVQTVTWNITNFTGHIVVQASLVTDPSASESNWFTIHTVSGTNSTQNSFVNLTGNYVWIRVKITDFRSGTIQNIKLSY